MTNVQPYNLSEERQREDAIFYMERILEVIELDCTLLAKKIFDKYQNQFQSLLTAEPFQQIKDRVSVSDNWTAEKEMAFFDRLKSASSFNEYKTVHDVAHEFLLHHDHPAESCPTHDLCDDVNKILAINNASYLEPDEVSINTFIDAKITFVVEQRRAKSKNNQPLEGNPGFHITDALNHSYRCFVKQVSDVEVDDVLQLKITNIPGLAISGNQTNEPIVYLEPRVVPGEKIEVEVLNLSHTGNSFTFRHHSYDGFLWFKRRGVNKEIFNQHTLKPKDKIVAKVLYTSEDVKRSPRGNITRLGVIKAIPLKHISAEQYRQADPNTAVAKVLS